MYFNEIKLLFFQKTVLNIAIEMQNSEIVKLLLQSNDIDPNKPKIKECVIFI